MELSYDNLDELASVHGPSFYIFDPKSLAKNFNELLAAFVKRYPKTHIAYSYKTNYLPRICQLVDQLGGYAEVVSSMELSVAHRIGVSPGNIFFNGPFKELGASEQLLSLGGVVNVDSLDELTALAASYENSSKKEIWRIGVRCNFPVEGLPISRFGTDVKSDDFLKIFEILKCNDHLKFDSLHCHFAPRNLACWTDTVNGVLKTLKKIEQLSIGLPATVSLGGGLHGNVSGHVAEQFAQRPPTFCEYAQEIQPLAEFLSKYEYEKRPTLIIEPGTALVADTMKFICRVNNVKKVNGLNLISATGSKFNVNSGSINPKFTVVNNSNTPASSTVENATICGFTCIESDTIADGFTGKITNGDFVIIDEVGSYSIVMKPPFILPNVPIIELGDGPVSSKTIKRKETWEDIFQTYNF